MALEQQPKLGEMLVKAKLLTRDQLDHAVDMQKVVGGRLGSLIVKLGYSGEKTLVDFIAKQQGLPVVNLEELVLPLNLVRRVPRALVEKHEIIPIAFNGDTLTIATSDPFDFDTLEEIQLALDYKVEIHLATRSSILKAIDEAFHRMSTTAVIRRSKRPDKSKKELMEDLEEERRVEKIKEDARSSSMALESISLPASDDPLQQALIDLLIDKGVITKEELARKMRK